MKEGGGYDINDILLSIYSKRTSFLLRILQLQKLPSICGSEAVLSWENSS